ncbi:putative Ig domain-containing protein [Methanosarcina sp. WWM596]|uniref:putative Ig domain-containing protein n=1 Tax=Methanosarcina sp. WWM596 TaxID=1434103 RepID=UPI0006160569|nr:putative Ig domain-containing protein [Methanosarcina sp. WWM596]AKB17617.1 hypothetical protein MSWHS_0754 [Methanosarcina sp. WWM596]
MKLGDKLQGNLLYHTLTVCIMFCFFLPVASASITSDSYWNIIIVQDETHVTLTDISNKLNDSKLIKNWGNGIWTASCIYSKNSTVYINNSEVTELRMTGQKGYTRILYGYNNNDKFKIHDVTITGWNETSNTYEHRGSIYLYNSELYNTNFQYAERINIYGDIQGIIHNVTTYKTRDFWVEGIKNGVIHDIYIQDSSGNSGAAFYVKNTIGMNIYNVKVNKTDRVGFYVFNSTGGTFHDISTWRSGNYLTPQTGYEGIVFSSGRYNYGYNLSVNDSGWSSFCPGGAEDGSTFRNVSVFNAGHNGIDIHPASNISVYDSIIGHSPSNNILLTNGNGALGGCNNIYFENLTLLGGGFLIGDDVHNVTVKNSIIQGNGNTVFNSSEIKFQNMTITTPPGYAIENNVIKFTYIKDGAYTYNGTIIDSSVDRIDSSKAINTRIINTNFSRFYSCNDAGIYRYLDLIIVDGTGTQLPDVTIDLVNEQDESKASCDGNGIQKTHFLMYNGRTCLPINNRAESPAILHIHYENSSYSETYSSKATITTPDGRTVSLSGIIPDSSWYREDPNVPTYTITAIIPEDSTSPQIIGFAPSTENPFNPGETKNFRVWTDEPLTEMDWYVDGKLVSEGSLNYTWTITKDESVIKFEGSNANGDVSKSWDVWGTGNNSSGMIVFFPENTLLFKNTGESVYFNVSSSRALIANWFVGGKAVLNDSTSLTYSWDTAGVYDVNVSGSADTDSFSNTWKVNVTEPEEPPSENKSIIMIIPCENVAPGAQFDLGIKIDPSTSINGAQLDILFDSSMVSASSVTEGDFFKQSGSSTIFNSGAIDNIAGTVINIYGYILGPLNVSTPGTFATVNLTAGNRTGIAEFNLSNVLISDASSKSAPYTVTNTSVLIDTAPVMDPICYLKSIDEKSALTFKVIAKDADGDELILSASDLPDGAEFNTESGNFSWIPAVGQAGVYTFTFEVSDGYLTDSENVTVTVNKLNNPPAIDSFEPLDGSSFSEGERIGISVNASDADGQALNYSIGIDGIEYSTENTYVWETDYSSSGNHTIEVAVSDGIEKVTEQNNIYINNYHPRWDVNQDGVVNILDITIIAQNYGSTSTVKPYPRWDVNQDGVVNTQDLTLAGYHFGETVV